MFRYIFWALAIYILYKLVTAFIIPVVKTTRTVRKQFKGMQQQMQEQMNAQQQYQNKSTTAPAGNKQPAAADDYIDFEEVK
jgi:Sec-independent protein translocase protein TatA